MGAAVSSGVVSISVGRALGVLLLQVVGLGEAWGSSVIGEGCVDGSWGSVQVPCWGGSLVGRWREKYQVGMDVVDGCGLVGGGVAVWAGEAPSGCAWGAAWYGG